MRNISVWAIDDLWKKNSVWKNDENVVHNILASISFRHFFRQS